MQKDSPGFVGSHDFYMQLAFRQALRGENKVAPNPVVGCIIVYQGEHSFPIADASKTPKDKLIVAIGHHRKYGEAHAEVNAIASAKSLYASNKDKFPGSKNEEDFFAKSTIYITLEPCAHQGQTPPCSDLIIKSGFKTLVYALRDPNPLVSGTGIKQIQEAGIEVIEPEKLSLASQKEAAYLNRRFLKWIRSQKAWLSLKIAATSEGSMITKPGEPRWITNAASRKLVHRLRATNQALITGVTTVLKDNPEMDVRHSAQELELDEIKQAQRFILSARDKFTEEDKTQLKIFTRKEGLEAPIEISINYKNSEGDFDFEKLSDFIKDLEAKNYYSIMVETGPTLSRAFLEAKLVDEIIHFEPIENPEDSQDIIKIILEGYISGEFLGVKIAQIQEEQLMANLIKSEGKKDNICLKILLS